MGVSSTLFCLVGWMSSFSRWSPLKPLSWLPTWPTSPSPIRAQWDVEMPPSRLHQGGSPGYQRGLCWHGVEEITVFSVIFGWSRTVSAWKVSVLLGCPFPGPLVREKKAFISPTHTPTPPTPVGVSPVAIFKSGLFEAKQKLRKLPKVSFLGYWGP